MVRLRYDMIIAHEQGVRERPYNHMTNLGYDIVNWYYDVIDVVIFEVLEEMPPLPDYLIKVDL